MKGKTALTIVVSILLVLAIISVASGDSAGTAQITSASPTLSSPQLWNAAETVDKNNTALTVNTEYHINFTVSETNSLADLNNVTIKIWETTYAVEGDADSERNHYTFTWTESTSSWSSSPSGFVTTANCKDPAAASIATSYTFTCAFDLSKVANHTSSNIAWQIKIISYDDLGNSDTDSSLKFGVAFYSEIAITDTTHTWTGLVPGDIDKTVDGDGDIDFTVIANDEWDANAKSNASNLVSGSNTIGIENLSIHKDTLGSAVALTTSWGDLGGLTTQSPPTAEASPVSTHCTLWLDVPNGTLPGDYVYTLQLQIVQG